MENKVSIGGGVGGHVVVGKGNVVGGPVPEPASGQEPAGGMTPRLGFVVDVVGFGQRDAEGRADLQRRLDELLDRVLADLGVDRDQVLTSDAGDSRVVFLPVGADSSRVLPALLMAVTERLGRDNRRYRDRMRLRMSAGTGLVGTGPLGFTGELVVDLHRLLDSAVVRQAVVDSPDTDLAFVVSQALHDEVIRPGHLAPGDFTRVEVTAKEFTAQAWLRVC